MENKTILVVVAHPDDEVLGCGGYMKLLSEKNDVYTLILGEGRPYTDYLMAMKGANKMLGVKEVFVRDFPDNQFDTVPLLDIVKEVEYTKNEISPDVIFTHHRGDLNIDHRKTFEAVITASRPMVGETVKEIYSFEVASSTEWAVPNTFNPNVFVDISNTFNHKIEANMVSVRKCEKGEGRETDTPGALL